MIGLYVQDVKHIDLLEHIIVEYASDVSREWTITALGMKILHSTSVVLLSIALASEATGSNPAIRMIWL